MQPTVASLVCYPVKGCAGVPVERTRIDRAGLRHDRRFVVVTADDGRFVSQRSHPVLATVRPDVRHDGHKLALSAPGTDDLLVDVDPDGGRRDVSVWSWQGVAADQGDDAARWFGDLLKTPVRLVRTPRGFDRRSATGGRVGFADGYGVLVVGESSLDGLNQRLVERGAQPLPMNRFRPNVVVRGWPEPHTEDTVGRLTVGAAEIAFAKVCKRCAVPAIDQETGAKAGPEPTRTLADYRRHDGGVIFGANYDVRTPGQVSVGDAVITHS